MGGHIRKIAMLVVVVALVSAGSPAQAATYGHSQYTNLVDDKIGMSTPSADSSADESGVLFTHTASVERAPIGYVVGESAAYAGAVISVSQPVLGGSYVLATAFDITQAASHIHLSGDYISGEFQLVESETAVSIQLIYTCETGCGLTSTSSQTKGLAVCVYSSCLPTGPRNLTLNTRVPSGQTGTLTAQLTLAARVDTRGASEAENTVAVRTNSMSIEPLTL